MHVTKPIYQAQHLCLCLNHQLAISHLSSTAHVCMCSLTECSYSQLHINNSQLYNYMAILMLCYCYRNKYRAYCWLTIISFCQLAMALAIPITNCMASQVSNTAMHVSQGIVVIKKSLTLKIGHGVAMCFENCILA